jgi:phosphoribosylglycinamide formyltransferase-1
MAFALERAKDASIPAITIDHKMFDGREHFDSALADEIDAPKPDVIVLAGFMRILSETFVNKYLGKLLNIHPSLLPKYPGLNTHQRAIDNNDAEHGTSIHFVTPELDGGPVILQAKVPVFEDDDVNELASRVLVQEHKIYPLVVNWLCNERIALNRMKVLFDGQELPECGYASD